MIRYRTYPYLAEGYNIPLNNRAVRSLLGRAISYATTAIPTGLPVNAPGDVLTIQSYIRPRRTADAVVGQEYAAWLT